MSLSDSFNYEPDEKKKTPKFGIENLCSTFPGIIFETFDYFGLLKNLKIGRKTPSKEKGRK